MSQRRWSAEHRKRISEALTGIKRSAETRAKIRAVTLGHAPTAWARWPYADHVFRSSYEVRVAKALDALGIEWQYEKHRFKLGESTYTPDFYLPIANVFLEVKGWFSPNAKAKVSAFRAQHPETPLIVVNKQAMEALEAAVAEAA